LGFRYSKEPSIKDVRSQGRGCCPVCTFFGQGERGSSDADVCTFSSKKIRIFSNYGVSARTREEWVEPVRTFCGPGVGQFFAILAPNPDKVSNNIASRFCENLSLLVLK